MPLFSDPVATADVEAPDRPPPTPPLATPPCSPVLQWHYFLRLPVELQALIVAECDQASLCALSLVSLSVLELAGSHLYYHPTLKGIESIEAMFCSLVSVLRSRWVLPWLICPPRSVLDWRRDLSCDLALVVPRSDQELDHRARSLQRRGRRALAWHRLVRSDHLPPRTRLSRPRPTRRSPLRPQRPHQYSPLSWSPRRLARPQSSPFPAPLASLLRASL